MLPTPHTREEIRERFEKKFWLHRVPSKTKQMSDILDFILQEVERAERKKVEELLKLIPEEGNGFAYLHQENAVFAKQLRDLLTPDTSNK